MLAFLPRDFSWPPHFLYRFMPGRCCFGRYCFRTIPEVGVFSMVMHTVFVLLNAIVGVIFLPRANKELFGDG